MGHQTQNSLTEKSVLLSVIVPMHNEEPTLEPLFSRLEKTLDAITPDYEIICVDDGSTDGTLGQLIQRRIANARIKVISLSRNFGKDIALSAGLDFANGRAVVPIDADLQDPPELIGPMVEKWREGFEVVYGTRKSRAKDTRTKRLTARWFYRLHNRLADVHIPEDTGDFRLMDRKVVEALKKLPENNRFMKGLFSWVGYRQIGIEYAREERVAGETKWKYWKLWNFALDGITTSSTWPLRIWTYFGVFVALMAISYAAYLVIRTVVFGVDVPGYASIMVAVLFLGSINIIATGIIGEYLGRVFIEVKNRPLYFVRDLQGLNRRAETVEVLDRNEELLQMTAQQRRNAS